MFENYLCIGGVEIANRTRTLQYLANVGHPYMAAPPNVECGDCFGNERTVTMCEVPYSVKAGLDASVEGELAAQVWEIFRGAESVQHVGVHRETRLIAGSPTVRPAVPTTGWVRSDYADPFTLPLLLSVDDTADCDPTAIRFERWTIYDIERWPVPHTSPPAPGEGAGTLSLLFYIDPCSAPTGFGRSSVSFDGGNIWQDMAGQTTPGQASGYMSFRQACVADAPMAFTFSSEADSTGFCHGFDYVAGGSGHFDVEVWLAPTISGPPPPAVPMPLGEASPWLLANLGQLTNGQMTVHFEKALCADWPALSDIPVGWYYMFWRYTDRITRAVYELVVAVNGLKITEATSTWTDKAAYSLDGGDHWHVPVGDTTMLTQPVARRDPVPTTPVEVETTDPFTTPAGDGAPWYDIDEPDSADVLGVWLEEITSPAPFKQDVRDRTRGGSLPRRQLTSRELHLIGYVYTRSCEATEYARRWLFEALAQEGCDDCDLPDAVLFRGCDPSTDSGQYLRRMRRVKLVEYNDELDPEFPCCLGFKFEVTMRAEEPYLYRDPITVYQGPVVDLADTPVCNLCGQCPEVPEAPYACGCLDTTTTVDDLLLANLQRASIACYCAPAMIRRFYVPVPSTGFDWSDATLRLTVDVGAPLSSVYPDSDVAPTNEGIRNLRIAGFQNPLGLIDPIVNGSDYFACQEPCIDVEISCLPPTSELVVDGSSRRSTVYVGPVTLNGQGYLSSRGGSRFRWPDVGCQGLMLVIESDAVFTAADTQLTVELVPRELR